MNSHELQIAAASIVRTAEGLLSGQISFLDGVRSLAALRCSLPNQMSDPELLLFTGIASELDHIPPQSVRSLCTDDWVAKTDAEAASAEAFYGSHVRRACETLVERFAFCARDDRAEASRQHEKR